MLIEWLCALIKQHFPTEQLHMLFTHLFFKTINSFIMYFLPRLQVKSFNICFTYERDT